MTIHCPDCGSLMESIKDMFEHLYMAHETPIDEIADRMIQVGLINQKEHAFLMERHEEILEQSNRYKS